MIREKDTKLFKLLPLVKASLFLVKDQEEYKDAYYTCSVLQQRGFFDLRASASLLMYRLHKFYKNVDSSYTQKQMRNEFYSLLRRIIEIEESRLKRAAPYLYSNTVRFTYIEKMKHKRNWNSFNGKERAYRFKWDLKYLFFGYGYKNTKQFKEERLYPMSVKKYRAFINEVRRRRQ